MRSESRLLTAPTKVVCPPRNHKPQTSSATSFRQISSRQVSAHGTDGLAQIIVGSSAGGWVRTLSDGAAAGRSPTGHGFTDRKVRTGRRLWLTELRTSEAQLDFDVVNAGTASGRRRSGLVALSVTATGDQVRLTPAGAAERVLASARCLDFIRGSAHSIEPPGGSIRVATHSPTPFTERNARNRLGATAGQAASSRTPSLHQGRRRRNQRGCFILSWQNDERKASSSSTVIVRIG